MCGVHQICSVLTELGIPYGHVYGAPGDGSAAQKAMKYAVASALEKKMRTVRIGSAGGRVKGMTEVAFDEFEIIKRTGARIVNLDEAELHAAAEKISEAEAEAEFEAKGLERFRTASAREEIVESMRYYLGMKTLIEQYGLEGFVVKCYPHYMGKICLGYSLLSEEGIVCGCEGDANNTVMMKILYELTGCPIHNTDILYPDTEANTLLFSHCGSGGFSISATQEEILLGPVRLADSGVCTLFTAKPGVVTLANLMGRGGTMRMSVIVGEAVPTGMEFPGNPLKVRFEKDVLLLSEEIAKFGVGHHWMAGYGDVSFELEAFSETKGIRYIRL
jgi:L-fucose isomerase-like protein